MGPPGGRCQASWCAGYTQADLIAVPREQADDVLLFAQRDPRACPLLDVAEPGAVSTPPFPGDLRTDLPAYRVYVDGVAAGEVGDVRDRCRPGWSSRRCGVTARYPGAHGAPVHVGDPAALGIADLDRPDYGDPVAFGEGDVPVFRACGVTPQAAVAASRPAFAIAHALGHMAITDGRDADLLVP